MPEEKLIIVIDELPCWAERDEALLSVMQKYIDTKWKHKNLMIILCGSALSFMENKVLSEKSPLFGRRDSQIRLEHFSYREAALFVPDYSMEDKAICYGITGGVAKYLSLIDREKEPTVLYTLEKLIRVGLAEKKRCMTEEKNKKKTQYVLKDHMFKFWYDFIPKAHSVIEMGQGDIYYEKVVKPKLHSFMGSVFEEMCRYYTLERSIQGRFDSFLTQVGSWWGVEQVENQMGEKVHDTLLRRASLVTGKYRVTRYLFFSLSGYTDWFDTLENSNVMLFSLNDLYR